LTAAEAARPKHCDAWPWFYPRSRDVLPELSLIAAAALLSQPVSALPLALLPLKAPAQDFQCILNTELIS